MISPEQYEQIGELIAKSQLARRIYEAEEDSVYTAIPWSNLSDDEVMKLLDMAGPGRVLFALVSEAHDRGLIHVE